MMSTSHALPTVNPQIHQFQGPPLSPQATTGACASTTRDLLAVDSLDTSGSNNGTTTGLDAAAAAAHHPRPLHAHVSSMEDPLPAPRKRKAGSQDNERLSKRLSLLNIEQNGPRLYVPVEAPTTRNNGGGRMTSSNGSSDEDAMRVDDSKHKVYIYNVDDELSSDSDPDDGKLVFLPDIEKHLRHNRIPRHVLVNDDGELAGMQMVLYSDPKSLSVPEERDGVRKAILEARRRHRDKQQQKLAGGSGRGQVSQSGGSPFEGVQLDGSGQGGMDPDYGTGDDDDAMDMD